MPIQHLVVIFQENVSFDHYFGTYPTAANTDGQPFHASPGTPSQRSSRISSARSATSAITGATTASIRGGSASWGPRPVDTYR